MQNTFFKPTIKHSGQLKVRIFMGYTNRSPRINFVGQLKVRIFMGYTNRSPRINFVAGSKEGQLITELRKRKIFLGIKFHGWSNICLLQMTPKLGNWHLRWSAIQKFFVVNYCCEDFYFRCLQQL